MRREIPEEVRERVRQAAGHRCGYCRSHQRYVLGQLEIEHTIPASAGGSDDEENLWLACRLCNHFKAVQTHGVDPQTGRSAILFNPRKQKWSRHFRWNGALMVGRTACGWATVAALNLNNEIALTVRRNWMDAGWHPPEEQ